MRAYPIGFVDDTGQDEPDEPDGLASLLASWKRHVRAQRISPSTIATYSVGVGRSAAPGPWHGMRRPDAARPLVRPPVVGGEADDRHGPASAG